MKSETTRTGFEVAVIGMAGRFPGANNIDEFWDNLENGVESISFWNDQELKTAGISQDLMDNPHYVKSEGGVIEGKEYFDALFFGYTPAEAELMDPQTRILHECSWEALENAGYDPLSYEGAVGLYAGATFHLDWQARSILSGKSNEIGVFTASHLTNKDFMTTRVSYKLNLKGPVVVVQTACSTSLVAIHMACRALLMGECDMTLAGGVTILSKDKNGYLYQEGLVKSPDGHCRAFDAKARGFIGGSGVGVVLLKRLKHAAAHGDHIYAVIKGSSINNDGFRKPGYTAPSIEGQVGVIKTALHVSQVEPGSITYVETHGTATPLGDPVEIEALKQAFNSDKKGYCAIGSVKTNIGHLDAAAGAASFIKTVLALKHRMIPPSLHFETPNPKIDFANSPFYVNTRLKEWKSSEYPLRAGVSSFGIGGTNTHVILEEFSEGTGGLAPLSEEETSSGFQDKEGTCDQEGTGGLAPMLFLLSAKTQTALDKMTANLGEYLKENLLNPGNHVNPINPGPTLADVAYTLQVGRPAFKYRRKLVCSNSHEATAALTSPGSPGVRTSMVVDEDRPVIFMFSGLGAQYVNMGLDLYQTEPVFREEMNRCFEILEPLMGFDLKEVLYPSSGSHKSYRSYKSNIPPINQPQIAQPIIFIFEYALAKLLMHWGIKPYAMIGYSFGEYTAACTAGVFSLEEALKLVHSRGELVQKTPEGRMLSVPLPINRVKPFLNKNLSVAIDNGASCIVAGPVHAVETLEKQMKSQRYLCMLLPVNRALHSHMMEPILTGFAKELGQLSLKKPQIPYISNVTGQWIKVSDAADPGYWTRHLRQTVRFADGIKELAKEKNALFIEIGPARDLNALVGRYIENNPGQQIINLVRHPDTNVSDDYYLLNKIGELWLGGKAIRWSDFYNREKRYRVPLPTYPFERMRCWIEADPADYAAAMSGKISLPGKMKKEDISRWFYLPVWKQAPLLRKRTPASMEPGTTYQWLLFGDTLGIYALLKQRLEKMGHSIITVTGAAAFAKQNPSTYTLNPGSSNDYQRLIKTLKDNGKIPQKILHLWGITTDDDNETLTGESMQKSMDNGFFSLVYLVKALEQENITGDILIDIVTSNMQDINGTETINPAKAMVLGPVKVIPQEYPNLRCRSIDVALSSRDSSRKQEPQLVDQLLEELTAPAPTGTIIGYRGLHRWERTFEPIVLEEAPADAVPLKKGGVYLITGGLGNIGFVLARYLAENFQAKLILTGRTPLPPLHEWDQWLTRNKNSQDDPVLTKIQKVRQLEALGAQVLVFAADAADREKMQAAVLQAQETFGRINGIVHAAGLIHGPSIRTLHHIQDSDCHLQFQAKIHGLQVLEQLFPGNELDFCWLMSSIGSVLGGLEFVAYSAANIFIDAFVSQLNRKGHRWIAVNWDLMKPGETVTAFQRILSLQDIDQVIVSTGGNLQERIQRWIKLETLRQEKPQTREEKKPFYPRPEVLTPYTAPRNSIEEALAKIFQDLFGFEEIGVHDDFFELGGDSLKAITVIYRIHKKLNWEIPLTEFFNRRTIEKLAHYLEKAGKEKHAAVEPVEKKEYYAVSPAQNRFYILQQFDSGGTAYNVPEVKILEGEPDKQRLEESFRGLIRRHEGLRTSFLLVNEELVQRVHDHVDLDIQYFDLTARNAKPSSPQEYIKNVVKSFDLSRAPLLRVGLAKINEKKYLLVADMHHLITDGVSYQLLVRDFLWLYHSGHRQLPSLRLQYKDYSLWQQRLWEREAAGITKQEDYWLKTFAGEIPLLDIPTDFTRPLVQRYEGDTVNFRFDKQQTRELKNMAQSQGLTLFMVLLTLYNILLYRLSGQEDIVVGTVLAGRNHTDLEQVIGVFLEYLALRNYPRGEKSFREFLQELGQRTLEAFESQDYPYEKLVEKVVKTRDTSRNPLYDVMLIYQNYTDLSPRQQYQPEQEPGKNNELQVKIYNRDINTAANDMIWFAVEIDQELSITVQFCTKLFKKETMRRFTGYFQNIATKVLNDPDLKIGEIEIISPGEKKKILFEFNHTAKSFPRDKCYHRLFEEQVLKTPGNIAARYNDQHIAFNELNKQANRIARFLSGHGVKPGTITALYMKRSIKILTAIIGVFKAGCAYLPIEYDYPLKRITYILENSQVTTIITTTPDNDAISHLDTKKANKSFCGGPGGSFFKKRLPMLHGAEGKNNLQHVLHLDSKGTSANSLTAYPDHNLDIEGDPHHLAYMIYTSGTTGNPKGVMIHQLAMMNHLDAKLSDYSLQEDDNIAQTASSTFDISVWQFLAVLLAGGTVHIIDKEDIIEPITFLKLLQKAKITILEAVPSLIRVFLDMVEQEANYGLKHLKRMIPTGEALPVDLARKWYDYYPGIKLVNAYGPAEAADDVGQYVLQEKPPENWKTVPIGKPLQNMHIYILDKNLSLCPIGVKGEICLAGVGVGKGYWKNPEKTRHSFIPNPFSKEINNPDYATLYRTGDIGSLREDGNVECLGRLDFQVKIRGNRIELGEIENQLRENKHVKEAVVIDREKDTGGKYLCAYVVPESTRAFEKSIVISGLREYLSKHLPDYMIPAYFIPMQRIPLTPNGKIDRKALPEPTIKINKTYIAPRNNVEEKLVETWSRILGLEKDKISIDADFFELGGNSIGLIRLAGEIYKTFHIEITVLQLFNMSRPQEIAAYINKNKKEPGHEDNYILLNLKQPKNLFAFPPIIGYGLGYKVLANLIKDYSVYAFNFIEAEDRLETYTQWITNIQEKGPYILFGYSAGGGLAFELAKQMEVLGHEVSDIIIMDAFRSDVHYSLIVDVGNPRLIAGLTGAVEFLGLPFIKEQLLRKVRAYTQYYENLVNDGVVKANIHFIRCSDYQERAQEVIEAAGRKDIEPLLSWEKSTHNRYFTYTGSGTHRDLFEPGNLEKNAKIINNILEKIEKKQFISKN